MRQGFGFVIATMLAACSGGGGSPGSPEQPDATSGGGSDAGGGGDGGGSADANADAAIIAAPPSFTILGPTVDVQANSEITYCYYFHTTNTTDLSIKKWTSHMTDGAVQMTLFLTPSDQKLAGVVDSKPCGLFTNGVNVAWTYSASTVDAQAELPSDDGNGQPLGQPVRAGQPAILQMHFLNSTAQLIQAHVELAAYAHADGVQATAVAPFATYHTGINMLAAPSPAMPTTAMVNGNCDVEAGAKFFAISAHTNSRGVHTFIKDGNTTVFDNVDWQNPEQTVWATTPFFSFSSGKLSYQCEYANPSGSRVETGDAANNEMCVAVGFYFPATDPSGHVCLNSAMLK